MATTKAKRGEDETKAAVAKVKKTGKAQAAHVVALLPPSLPRPSWPKSSALMLCPAARS